MIKIQFFALFRFGLAAGLLAVSCLHAQNAQFSSMRSVLQFSTAPAASPVYTPATAPATYVMIANRARTLGNEISGSGARYFALRDYDLRGLTPEQILQRLAPAPVSAGEGVRKLEILVDLQHPLRIEARPGQSIDIGTAVVQAAGGYQRIEVNASIFTADLTVNAK